MRDIEKHNPQLTNVQPNELLIGYRPTHHLRLRPNCFPNVKLSSGERVKGMGH